MKLIFIRFHNKPLMVGQIINTNNTLGKKIPFNLVGNQVDLTQFGTNIPRKNR